MSPESGDSGPSKHSFENARELTKKLDDAFRYVSELYFTVRMLYAYLP